MSEPFAKVPIETVDHFMKPLANPKVDATVPDHFDGAEIKPFAPAAAQSNVQSPTSKATAPATPKI